MIKKILIVAGAVIALLGIVVVSAPLFMPNSYTIERSIEIAAPAPAVYPYLGDFREFMRWQPWIRYEPDAKTIITGAAFAVGSRYAWEGKKLGTGSMTITASKKNEFVETELVFDGKNGVRTQNRMTLAAAGKNTKVTWKIQGNMAYFERYFAPMMNNMLGKDFESGLKNLKEIIEKK